jgi:hypothetical protein
VYLFSIVRKFHLVHSAFSSFPDTTSFETGSQPHSFRIRDIRTAAPQDNALDAERPAPLDGFMYGFASFHQKRDASVKRGYFQVYLIHACQFEGQLTAPHSQRSVVVLTQHPLPSLFLAAINNLAPLYVAHGTAMLETASYNIASWQVSVSRPA